MGAQFRWVLLCCLLAVFAAVSLASAGAAAADLWTKSVKAEADGDYAVALKIHLKILPMVGTSYAASLRAGWLCYLNEDYQHALNCYQKAASLSAGALAPLYGAMNCHLAEQRTKQAVKVAKAILVIDALNYTANKQLAMICYKEKNFSLAAAYYRKLYRLYPEDSAVAGGLAWSFLELGESRKALSLFKGILMTSPDDASAQWGLELCNQF